MPLTGVVKMSNPSGCEPPAAGLGIVAAFRALRKGGKRPCPVRSWTAGGSKRPVPVDAGVLMDQNCHVIRGTAKTRGDEESRDDSYNVRKTLLSCWGAGARFIWCNVYGVHSVWCGEMRVEIPRWRSPRTLFRNCRPRWYTGGYANYAAGFEGCETALGFETARVLGWLLVGRAPAAGGFAGRFGRQGWMNGSRCLGELTSRAGWSGDDPESSGTLHPVVVAQP